MEQKHFSIFTDGGARGNPGPAGVGVVVKDNQGKIIARVSKYIGKATNNVAEYSAVIEALTWIKGNLINSVNSINSINFFLDSKLIVNQLNGMFKVKNGNLRSLIVEVRKLEKEIGGGISYSFIPREKNFQADFLVNKILSETIP